MGIGHDSVVNASLDAEHVSLPLRIRSPKRYRGTTAPRRRGLRARIGGDYSFEIVPIEMTDRVVVFIDYQNVYMGAREAFCGRGGPHTDGQIAPWRLGELLTSRGLVKRALVEVRVYRGLPEAGRDPRTHAACSRQCESWRRQATTRVLTRALRYPYDWPREKAREKGIDVALAVDFVAMAVRAEYDVGVLMSADTDLKPALEFVSSLPGSRPRCEVAAWSAPSGHSRRLSVAGHNVWCHWLSEIDYQAVADPTDYARDERSA